MADLGTIWLEQPVVLVVQHVFVSGQFLAEGVRHDDLVAVFFALQKPQLAAYSSLQERRCDEADPVRAELPPASIHVVAEADSDRVARMVGVGAQELVEGLCGVRTVAHFSLPDKDRVVWKRRGDEAALPLCRVPPRLC